MRRLSTSTEQNTGLTPITPRDLLGAKPPKCWWQVDVNRNRWLGRELFRPATLSERVIKTFSTRRPLIDPRWAGRVHVYCGVKKQKTCGGVGEAVEVGVEDGGVSERDVFRIKQRVMR